MLWVCQEFRRYLDEKKGLYGPMSGHVHFCDVSLIEVESKKLLYSQLSSVQALNRENDCFTPLLNDLNGIIRNSNASWEQKNFLFQQTFKSYLPILPEDKVPSFLFKSNLVMQTKLF